MLHILSGEIGTSTNGISSVAEYLRYTKLQSINQRKRKQFTFSIAEATSSGNGPLLPIHVIHPYPTMSNLKYNQTKLPLNAIWYSTQTATSLSNKNRTQIISLALNTYLVVFLLYFNSESYHYDFFFGGSRCGYTLSFDQVYQWLLAYHYGQPPSTLGLSNISLGLYLDGWP